MRRDEHSLGSRSWRLRYYIVILALFILDAQPMFLQRRATSTEVAESATATQPSDRNVSPLPATPGQPIPLWGRCGLGPDEICAEGSCICKDQWWSQCRIQINGSWVPRGEDWLCTEPETKSTAPLEHVSPLVLSQSQPVTEARPVAASTVSLSSNSPPPAASSDFHSQPHMSVPSFATSRDFATFPTNARATLVAAINSSQPYTTNKTSHSRHTPTDNPGIPPTTTRAVPLRGSAYANSAVLSDLSLLPISSTTILITAPVTAPARASSGAVNGLPLSSTTSLLPNLACPKDVAVKQASHPESSQPVAIQACDPDMSVNPVMVSSTTNTSSNLTSPTSTVPNPDKTGIYQASNATQDQSTHCSHFAAHQSQECWDVLNVTGYIQDWLSYNQRTCNEEEMGFADCFLYIELGGGANCTAFTGRSQCLAPDAKTFVNRKNGAQAYYVAFNIWNIQNWFFTYYMAVTGANGLAADNVNIIARSLNVPVPKSISVLDILAGLAFAFGLLSPSGYAATIPKLGRKLDGFAAQAPGEYLLRGIQGSPTFARNMLYKGDLSDTNVQIATLSSDLARITSQLQNNIQNSVVVVMSNYSLFFDFVQDGYFSTQIESLDTITQNVTLALNTYLVSQALQDDDVIITRAIDTDVNELQVNGSAYQYDTGCGHGYDEWGMCANWWYDSTNHISYGLESMKDMLNNYTDGLESLFNQGIITPELLFMNSQFCADAAGSTQGNAPGTSLSTTTGIWNTECISNMKICTWDQGSQDMWHEYTDCDRESSFAAEGCGGPEEIVQYVVPASYIGPYLTNQLFQGQVCNHWDKGMGNPG